MYTIRFEKKLQIEKKNRNTARIDEYKNRKENGFTERIVNEFKSTPRHENEHRMCAGGTLLTL